jgi:hypothetical protein
MSTATSITTTYAGEFAGKYIAAALLSSPTLEKGLVTIKPNVKYRETVKKLATGGMMQDATCDFTSAGSVTLAERILEPKELQVNQVLCKKDFRSDWEAVQMGYSATDVLPPTFSEFLISHMVAKIAQENEIAIWRGAAGTNGSYNGLTTLIALDAGLPAAQEIAAVGGGVLSTNVIAELGKIFDACPAALYGNEGLTLFVSQNIYKAYVRALGGFGASGLGAAGTNAQGTQWYSNGSGLSFDGIRVEMVQGLASNTAVLAEKENLWFGTGLLSDHNEIKVLDMGDLDGSQNVRFVARMTAGVQYGNIEEIVTYGITNSAN